MMYVLDDETQLDKFEFWFWYDVWRTHPTRFSIALKYFTWDKKDPLCQYTTTPTSFERRGYFDWERRD